MSEIDVTLTDYLLALLTIYFAKRLHSIRTDTPMRHWSIALFLALAGATLLGGTVHGFLTDPASTVRKIAWVLTMLFVGVAALAAWAISAHLLFSGQKARWITRIAGVEFLGYAGFVCFFSDDFQVAIINYAISAVVMFFGLLKKIMTGEKGPFKIGALGIALTFLAAGVQSARLDLFGLSHNAVYHLIQAVGLLLVFQTLSYLSKVPRNEAANATRVTSAPASYAKSERPC